MSRDFPSSESVEDNIIKCVICFGEAVDSVLLNCLHSACRSCAKDKVNTSVTCPTCHVTTDLSGWKTNLLVSSHAHRSRVLKSIFSCTPCSDEGELETTAVVWCYTCQRSLCADCETHHTKLNSTHKCKPLSEKTNISECYLPPAHSCLKHDNKLEFACFTCKDVYCSKCVPDCYKSSHEVLHLDDADALTQVQNNRKEVAAALSELHSAITFMQLNISVSEKVANARQESLTRLETAKIAAVDSISNAYRNSEESVLNCWDSLDEKLQDVEKLAEVLKNRVQWTDKYCEMAINSNDVCGFIPQLNVVFAALRSLQEKAQELKKQIDTKMLVMCPVCLPRDLDLITAGWFGKACIVSDDYCCSVDNIRSKDCDDYYTRKVASLKELEQLTQNVKEQLQAIEQSKLKREAALAATQNEIETLLDQQTELQEQLTRERGTVEQLKEELNSKEQQLVSTQNENKTLLGQTEKLQEELLGERGTIDKLSTELKSKEQQLVDTQNEGMKLLAQQREQQQKQLEGERRRVVQLQLTLLQLTPKAKQLDSIMKYAGKGGVFLLLSICLLAILTQLFTDQGMGYESAFRTAVNSTIGITPPATLIFSQIQSFSNCLSPAYREFDAFPVYTGCQDAYLKGFRQPGVFAISRSGSLPFRAWCDFDGSGGWMVIQRRVDGTVDFYRRWEEYEPGFGNLWGEYWLGLDKMHLMTTSAVALSVYLKPRDGSSAWANYSTFSIGDAASRYTITVSGFNGSTGDSLSGHSGNRFSTHDYDNDRHEGNCAQSYYGSWWYNSCATSNLNGRYSTTSSTSTNFWYAFQNYDSLNASIMRILA